MTISAELIGELRDSLKGGSKVYLPGEEGYQKGVTRWSEYSEKAAVRVSVVALRCDVFV
jgi:hypothetical protein